MTILSSLLLAASATATPPAKLGLCDACHGLDGQSRTPDAPHIGGQNEAYLVRALNQYRDGQRKGEAMNAIAGMLSPRDIEALAGWYAAQTWPATRQTAE